ncbi:MAG: OmpA family protein [Vampirovibrionales bacterium]
MALNLESSMTDLMTSLAVVFILLMLALAQNQAQEQQNGSARHLKEIQKRIDYLLVQEHLTCEADERDPLSCIIRLPEDKIRFEVNKDIIDPKGQAFLKRMFPPVLNTLNAPEIKSTVDSLYIQGFTDSDGNDEHNLELSQKRAFSVGRFVVSFVIPPSNKRNQLLKWLYVNGRGEQELRLKSGKEDKQASRRVEVKIRVKSSEQRQAVQSTLKSPTGV